MKINTKYNFGDFVYPIRMGGYEKFINCELCDGIGKLTIENKKTITCPDCYGRCGNKEYIHDKYYVSHDSFGAVGSIRTELYDNKYTDKKSEITYMLDSTGVGSGTLWKEGELFKTSDEAQAECDKRNNNK